MTAIKTKTWKHFQKENRQKSEFWALQMKKNANIGLSHKTIFFLNSLFYLFSVSFDEFSYFSHCNKRVNQ